MIPQAELDRALARWKARQMGQEAPTPGPVSMEGAMPDTEATRITTAPMGQDHGASFSLDEEDFGQTKG